MIAVDTSILVYAHREDSAFHKPARDCVRALAEGSVSWAIAQIESWLASPSLSLLAESSLHWQALKPLLTGSQVIGAQVHDARIAALCIQHGVHELWTADRDLAATQPLGRSTR